MNGKIPAGDGPNDGQMYLKQELPEAVVLGRNKHTKQKLGWIFRWNFNS